MFSEYNGDLMGLYSNENHIVYRWNDETCKILFSVCRQGNGAVCNFASDKKGLRKLKIAIKEWISFIFDNFQWCEMVLAEVKLNSVKKLVKKFGFEFIDFFDSENPYDAYYLRREKHYG